MCGLSPFLASQVVVRIVHSQIAIPRFVYANVTYNNDAFNLQETLSVDINLIIKLLGSHLKNAMAESSQWELLFNSRK